MKIIYKYYLFQESSETILELPRNARVLSVQVQRGETCLWALVNPEQPLEPRTFVCQLTGGAFDPTGLEYVSTYQNGWFVGHVFERV